MARAGLIEINQGDSGSINLRKCRLNQHFLRKYDRAGKQKDAAGWWYPYGSNQGEYHINNAVRIDGKLYFFNTEGYCVANPEIEIDDKGALRYIRGKRVQ